MKPDDALERIHDMFSSIPEIVKRGSSMLVTEQDKITLKLAYDFLISREHEFAEFLSRGESGIKRLKLKERDCDDGGSRFPDDEERIVAICAANGYEITPAIAALAWHEYSDTLCASWLILPKDDATILKHILEQCDVEQ